MPPEYMPVSEKRKMLMLTIEDVIPQEGHPNLFFLKYLNLPTGCLIGIDGDKMPFIPEKNDEIFVTEESFDFRELTKIAIRKQGEIRPQIFRWPT